MIRTRFAPSPTGSLHVGNARIAVLNWLFARRHGGAFILRIEDTDLERNVPGAEAELLADLEWLGLDHDEGPGVEGPAGEGPHAPYRQSERGAVYRDHAERLLRSGDAFRCFCTAAELERHREIARASGANPHYPGTCRRLSQDEALQLEAQGQRPVIRFRVEPEGEIEVDDVVRGTIRFPAAEISDFIILRSDAVPTYNFAVVVDDALMRITHVIRGAGHLSNTPRQLLLFRALGSEPPRFAHVPTVLGPDRQKLSKRHGARPLADYRREGYHADGVLNYLSLLAWSIPSGDEYLTRARLINEISLERIGAADVVFDEGKLRWLSGKHIAAMPLQRLVEAVEPYIDRDRFPIPEDVLPAAVAAVRTHLQTFSEITDHLEPFVPVLDERARVAVAGSVADPAARAVVRTAAELIAQLDAWELERIDAALREVAAATGARGRPLYEPLRTALTGRPDGPPLKTILFVIGRSASLRLLHDALVD